MPLFKPTVPTNVVDFPGGKPKAPVGEATLFEPPTISSGPTSFARSYMSENQSQAFTMSETVKIQSGVQQLENAKLEFDVQTLVDRRLKEVQKLAQSLGFEEGKAEGAAAALSESRAEIQLQVASLTKLLAELNSLKVQFMKQNENHFILLTFAMAKKLLQSEIKANPEVVLGALKSAIEETQSEENIKVFLNPEMMKFITTNIVTEMPPGTTFEERADLDFGSCVIETAFGSIDSKINDRVEKLWLQIESQLHQSQEKFSL